MKHASLSIRHEACLIKRQKTGGCFPSHAKGSVVGRSLSWSGGSGGMLTLGGHKGRSFIGFFLDPHGEQDAHPDIGQGSDGHTMTLALAAFALVVVLGPRFLLRTLPGKLMQGEEPRLDAGKAVMDRSEVATDPRAQAKCRPGPAHCSHRYSACDRL